MRKTTLLIAIILLFSCHIKPTFWHSFVFFQINSTSNTQGYSYGIHDVLYPKFYVALLGSDYNDYIMNNLGVNIKNWESDINENRLFLSLNNDSLNYYETQTLLANFFINRPEYEKLVLKIGNNDWKVFTMNDINLPFFIPVNTNYISDSDDRFIDLAEKIMNMKKKELIENDESNVENNNNSDEINEVIHYKEKESNILLYSSIVLNIILFIAIVSMFVLFSKKRKK
jgi:hypothetical protein